MRDNINIFRLLEKNNKLFDYSQEEVDSFIESVPLSSQKGMFQSVSKFINTGYIDLSNRMNYLIDTIQTLDSENLKMFEDFVKEWTETNPHMLWNMLHKDDQKLYKDQDRFYAWISTLSDEVLDTFIYKAAEGERLHSAEVYEATKHTKVEILDGYIAISSTNLKALEKFRDRMLSTNDFTYEHRIKKHGEYTIHSYVFDTNKTE
jgi:hypothetical protein